MAQIGCAFSFLSLLSGAANAQQIAATSGRLTPAAKSNFAAQFQAFQAEKAALTPAQRKLATPLAFSLPAKKARVARSFAAFRGFAASADERVDVIITAKVNNNVLSAIARAGGEVLNVVPTENAVRALLSPAGAEKVAALDEVTFIRLYDPPRTKVGPQTTEGDVAHVAAPSRQLFKVAGRGIKIGVISDGVKSLTKSQLDGELPARVAVIKNGQGKLQSGNGDEGTAMLEIVHDIAPEAQLFFATANGGEEVFADNIKRLRQAGCDIIVDDIIYLSEGVYQDGVVAQAVNEVVDDGALFFSAAGNNGNLRQGTSQTWDGQFRAGDTLSTEKGIATIHLWGDQESNPVITNSTAQVVLQWADPLGKSANDYDLYVLDSNGDIVSASQDVQAGSTNAFETTLCTPGSKIVVTRQSGEARPLYIQVFGGSLGIGTTGSNYSHSAAAKAIGVAAVSAQVFDDSALRPFRTSDETETFSADGFRTYYFDAAGKKKTYTVKTPQIAAADGVTTSVAGFQRFFGTSAAAPHAAALAALVWSFDRKQSPEDVKQVLYSTALDIMGSGYDKNSGFGLVRIDRAFAKIGPPVLSLASNEIRANEGSSGTKTIKVTVNLSKMSEKDEIISFATKALTARNNVDFQAKNGTLTLSKGAKTASVFFAINGDTEFEADETFEIRFSKVSTLFSGSPVVTVTIVNDDKAPASTESTSTQSS